MAVKKAAKPDEIFKEVTAGRIVLAVIPAARHDELSVAPIRMMTRKGIIVTYLSANKPFKTLLDELAKRKVDTRKVFFIDTASKATGKYFNETEKNCIFINSPRNLTDISIALNETMNLLKSRKKAIVIDSVNTLILYNDVTTVLRFLHLLSGRMRNWNVGSIIMAIREETPEEIKSQLAQFCDKTFELKG